MLQFFANEDTANPLNLSADISDFQVQAVLSDGSVVDTLGTSDDWTDLTALDISLTGQVTFDDRTLTRTVSARFFPRNVLSH